MSWYSELKQADSGLSLVKEADMPSRLPEDKQDQIVSLYNDGHSTYDVAKIMNKSRQAIINVLMDRKVKIRNMSEATKTKWNTPQMREQARQQAKHRWEGRRHQDISYEDMMGHATDQDDGPGPIV